MQSFSDSLRVPGGNPKQRERRTIGSAAALLPVLQGCHAHADHDRELALMRARFARTALMVSGLNTLIRPAFNKPRRIWPACRTLLINS
jgi:hypothetical protein